MLMKKKTCIIDIAMKKNITKTDLRKTSIVQREVSNVENCMPRVPGFYEKKLKNNIIEKNYNYRRSIRKLLI